MNRNICETCKWWDEDTENKYRFGYCRHSAPRPRDHQVKSDNYTTTYLAYWLETTNEDWCSEWQATKTAPDLQEQRDALLAACKNAREYFRFLEDVRGVKHDYADIEAAIAKTEEKE